MQSKSATPLSETSGALHLYEYAVVRFMPSVERGEFVNIGLVMMCKRARWVMARFLVNEDRIRAFCPEADIDALRHQLEGFGRIASGDTRTGGPIATLEAHERFRWLTAVRSACLRTSRPHAGLTPDLDTTFANLFATLVE